MIIELLLDALYQVFNILTSPINIPTVPVDELSYFIDKLYEWLAMGYNVLANYIHAEICFAFLGIILFVDLAIAIYHFVMWILRKIPMASIS